MTEVLGLQRKWK